MAYSRFKHSVSKFPFFCIIFLVVYFLKMGIFLKEVCFGFNLNILSFKKILSFRLNSLSGQHFCYFSDLIGRDLDGSGKVEPHTTAA